VNPTTAFCEAPLVDDALGDALLCAFTAVETALLARATEAMPVLNATEVRVALDEPDEELEAVLELEDDTPEVEAELLAEPVLDADAVLVMPLALPDDVVETDTAAVTAAAPLYGNASRYEHCEVAAGACGAGVEG
jgi:hypothetical protein